MGKITVFKNGTETKSPFHIGIETAIARIKGGKSKKLIEKIRSIDDSKERGRYKNMLTAYCFSGEFSERNDASIITHSGFVAIDFDHVENLNVFKARICNDPITHVAFISPSGDGLKIIVKIPASVDTHKQSCEALVEYFNEESLDSFKDLSRLCYESYDPDIYYNPKSVLFETLPEKKPQNTFTPKEAITDFNEILERIEKWMDSELCYYADGNKHNFLVKIASACNRFGIPEGVCSQKLIFGYSQKASPVEPQDIDKIVSAIYRNYAHASCTAIFEKNGEPIDKVTKKKIKEDIFKSEVPLKDTIYLDNVRESMLHTFQNGLRRGESTYFNELDEIYRLKRGELTLFHGIMNHGKSTLLMQLLLIKAVKNDYKFAFFSPEQNPPDDFYDDLIHMYVGQNTQPYYDHQMTSEQYTEGMNFVKDHFFYIYPEDEMPTPEYINECFDGVIKKHKIDGCVIDPYNQLDNDISRAGGREDLYLSKFLTKQKRFAIKNDIFMFLVAHPKGGLKKDNSGDYEVPNVYDLAGGAMWGNKCDNIVYVHRPHYTSDKMDTTVMVGSQKIKKQKLCGRPGDIEMGYKLDSMRFVIEGFNPLNKEIIDDKDAVPF